MVFNKNNSPPIPTDPIQNSNFGSVPKDDTYMESRRVKNTFIDYIPGNPDVISIQKPKQEPKRILIESGVDYRSGEESKKAEMQNSKKIHEIAAQLLQEHSDSIRRYEIACKIIDAASSEDFSNPSDRLRKAVAIKNAGHPMTRKKARDEAELMLIRKMREGIKI